MLITPQTAGETRRYEDIMIEILRDNWGCLWCREAQLGNQVVWNPYGSAPNSVLPGRPDPSTAQQLDETSACVIATSP